MEFKEACVSLDEHFEVDPGVIEDWVRAKIGGFRQVATKIPVGSDDWDVTLEEGSANLFRGRNKRQPKPLVLFHIRRSLAAVFDVKEAADEGIVWESAPDEVRALYRKKDQFEITVS